MLRRNLTGCDMLNLFNDIFGVYYNTSYNQTLFGSFFPDLQAKACKTDDFKNYKFLKSPDGWFISVDNLLIFENRKDVKKKTEALNKLIEYYKL